MNVNIEKTGKKMEKIDLDKIRFIRKMRSIWTCSPDA